MRYLCKNSLICSKFTNGRIINFTMLGLDELHFDNTTGKACTETDT